MKDLRDHRGSGKTEVSGPPKEGEAGQVTQMDDATAGQPQTNGVAEKAVQDVTTQVRKCKIALETRLSKPIHARSVVFKWLVRHAADIIDRESVGHDGKVPLQRLTHKLPKPIDIEFGEQVWAKTPSYKNHRKCSLQERSTPGTYLGIWAPTGQKHCDNRTGTSC